MIFNKQDMLPVILLFVIVFAPSCSSKEGTVFEQAPVSPPVEVKDETGEARRHAAGGGDQWIRDKYYDSETQAARDAIKIGIGELLSLDPVKNEKAIRDIASGLRQYGDEALRAVAESYEGNRTIKGRTTFIIALEVMNRDIARRYIDGLMNDLANATTKSAEYVGPIMGLVNETPGAVPFLKKMFYDTNDVNLRKNIIKSIGRAGDSRASEALHEIAYKNLQYASVAIKAMAGIKAHDNAERLVEMIFDPKMSSKRKYLVWALKVQKEGVAGPLIDVLKKTPQKDKMNIINLIGNVGRWEVLDELGYYYKSYAATELTTEQKIGVLNLLQKLPRAKSDVALQVAEDILMNEKDDQVRREALRLFSMLGDSRSVLFLKSYEEKTEPEKLDAIKEGIKRTIEAIEKKKN